MTDTIRSVVCPSGLSGEVRGLKTKEANLFADPSFLRSNTGLDQVLSNCWLNTTDSAIYPAGKLNWGSVLLCDRFFALLQIRIATYGPQYDFAVQCTQQTCRQKFEWSIDLENQLRCKPLPEASRAAFLAGNTFHTTLGDTACKFKLLTGADERQIMTRVRQAKQQLGGNTKGATISLASRLTEIEGVHPNDKLRWLDELDMGDAMEFLAVLDDADGGIETAVEVECTHCGSIMDIELPFDRAYWVPKRRTSRTSMTL